MSTGKGRFMREYSGGTYEENELVALSEGCVHDAEEFLRNSPMWNLYCCPL
jgi:hypothetical protein